MSLREEIEQEIKGSVIALYNTGDVLVHDESIDSCINKVLDAAVDAVKSVDWSINDAVRDINMDDAIDAINKLRDEK